MINKNITEIIKSKKRAGVSLPLFSLYTKKSYAVGDIYSLEVLGEWAQKAGITIIQILPLNDLGFGRSPYSSISAFAIDPVYISLYLLGIGDLDIDIQNRIDDKIKIKERKIKFLKEYFINIINDDIIKKINNFIQDNEWLDEYVSFVLLNYEFNGVHWSLWQKEFSKELVKELRNKNENEFLFIAWLQLIAFEQLKDQKLKLQDKGVYLKGDMPILTSDHSADVWARTYLFNRDLKSGAPPDYFNTEGQNWGFPVIDWKEMKREKFSWWKMRLEYLENFYHLYRIDHVLGMYRIWAIPKGKESAKYGYFHPQKGVSRKEFNQVRLFPEDFEKLGLIYEFKTDHYIFYWDFFKTNQYQSLPEEIKAKFYPLSELHLKMDEEHWRSAGEEILNFLFENSSMLPCAEDLGAVPSFVRDSIHEMKLLGLDIIRWTRSFEDGSYIKPEGYRKVAVSSLSVHDTSTALGWWLEASENDRKEFSKLFKDDLINKNKLFEDNKPLSIEDIPTLLLSVALKCSSQLSIHMLQDYILSGALGMERNGNTGILIDPNKQKINTPGTPEDKNWGYVFPFYVEDLLEDLELTKNIKGLIKMSGRLA